MSRAVDTTLSVLLVAASFLLVCFPLQNTDIWWHLAAGRQIWHQGGIPSLDTLSIGTVGKAWIDIHWLFQWCAHLVHAGSGTLGLVLAKCALFAASAAWLFQVVMNPLKPPVRWPAALLLLLALWPCRELVLARPVVFSLTFSTLFLWTLQREAERGPTRWLWLLPVIQVAWVNSQSLFVLGPGLVGAWLLGLGWQAVAGRLGFSGFGPPPAMATVKRLAVLLALVVVACLVNPWGLNAFRVVWSLTGRIAPGQASLFSTQVSENVPTWTRLRAGDPMAMEFLIIAAAVFASFLIQRRRMRVERLLVALGLFVPALSANRNLLLFIWLAVPLGLVNLGEALANHLPVAGRAMRRLTASLAIATLLMAGVAVWSLWPRACRALDLPAPFRVPVRSAEVLAEALPTGNVFCSVRFGGYLAWRLPPEHKPIVDGRLVLRSAAWFADYLAVLEEPERFDEFCAPYGITAAVLPVQQPDRYQRLIQTLYRRADWRLRYTDGWQVLFIHSSAGLPQAIDLSRPADLATVGREIERVYPLDDQPAAFAQFGTLLNLLGLHDQALTVLRDRPDFDCRSVLARSLFLAGDKPTAGEIASRLVEERPGHVESLLLLAVLAGERGDRLAAIDFATRVLEIDPDNEPARRLLARLTENRDREPGP